MELIPAVVAVTAWKPRRPRGGRRSRRTKARRLLQQKPNSSLTYSRTHRGARSARMTRMRCPRDLAVLDDELDVRPRYLRRIQHRGCCRYGHCLCGGDRLRRANRLVCSRHARDDRRIEACLACQPFRIGSRDVDADADRHQHCRHQIENIRTAEPDVSASHCFGLNCASWRAALHLNNAQYVLLNSLRLCY